MIILFYMLGLEMSREVFNNSHELLST